MARQQLTFEAQLWLYDGPGGWHFVTLPGELADDIRARNRPGRGFGSLRVQARVGASTWSTSIFPDTRTGSYLLPVKRSVRDAEGIADGDLVAVRLQLAD